MAGPKILYAHTTASMSSTTGAVLAANNDRKYALVVNDGSVDVYLKVGADAGDGAFKLQQLPARQRRGLRFHQRR